MTLKSPQIRRSRGAKAPAPSTPPSVTSKPNRSVNCPVHGCCWRGTCPVHTVKYPDGFTDIAHMMRVRPYGPAASSIGIGNCALDLHPEVRARRLAAEVAVALHWEQRNQRPVPRLEPGCAGGGSAAVLRDRWENQAAKLVAA